MPHRCQNQQRQKEKVAVKRLYICLAVIAAITGICIFSMHRISEIKDRVEDYSNAVFTAMEEENYEKTLASVEGTDRLLDGAEHGFGALCSTCSGSDISKEFPDWNLWPATRFILIWPPNSAPFYGRWSRFGIRSRSISGM